MSDQSGHMHPIALCIVSHIVEESYLRFLNDIKELYATVHGGEVKPDFVMMDAECAEWKAVERVFPSAVRLMCWFHVKKNCMDRIKRLDNSEGK